MAGYQAPYYIRRGNIVEVNFINACALSRNIILPYSPSSGSRHMLTFNYSETSFVIVQIDAPSVKLLSIFDFNYNEILTPPNNAVSGSFIYTI